MASENSLHRLFAGYQHKCSGRGFGERSQGSVRGAEYRLSRRLGIAWILGCCATLKTRSNFSAQCRHILSDLVVGDLGVNLGRGDMFMSQHLRYGFQRYALRERDRRGKCMPAHVDRRIERQPACLVTCRNDIPFSSHWAIHYFSKQNTPLLQKINLLIFNTNLNSTQNTLVFKTKRFDVWIKTQVHLR